MSFLEIAEQVINEGTIQVYFLIDQNGQVVNQHGEWPDLNAASILQTWQSNASSFLVGNIKFSVIDKGDDRFVGRSLGGDGTVVLVKCLNWAGYLITWAQNDVQTRLAYTESAKMANAVKA